MHCRVGVLRSDLLNFRYLRNLSLVCTGASIGRRQFVSSVNSSKIRPRKKRRTMGAVLEGADTTTPLLTHPTRRFIVGLGNKGSMFDGTRHNIGAAAIQALANKWHLNYQTSTILSKELSFTTNKSASTKQEDRKTQNTLDLVDRQSERRRLKTRKDGVAYPNVLGCLFVPGTFMNISGNAIRVLQTRQELTLPDELLVLHDDLDLPFGHCVLKRGGSSGGHNGIKDINDKLMMDDDQKKNHSSPVYYRLKIGIGKAKTTQEQTSNSSSLVDTVSYVLGSFSTSEQAEMSLLFDFIMEVIRVYLHRGPDAAQRVCNGRDYRNPLKNIGASSSSSSSASHDDKTRQEQEVIEVRPKEERSY